MLFRSKQPLLVLFLGAGAERTEVRSADTIIGKRARKRYPYVQYRTAADTRKPLPLVCARSTYLGSRATAPQSNLGGQIGAHVSRTRCISRGAGIRGLKTAFVQSGALISGRL